MPQTSGVLGVCPGLQWGWLVGHWVNRYHQTVTDRFIGGLSVTYSVGQGVSSRYVQTAWRHAGLISWAHGHGRSMSVALCPASVMARASLQQPAQAQTDPHKKMNTDNINNAGGLCSPSWIPLHTWRTGKFLSTDHRLTKAGVRSNFDAIVNALHLLPRMTKVHQVHVVLSS